MDYGEILSKAWRIIWRHKVLWIFGILAGCSSAPGNSTTGSGNVEYNFGPGDLPNQVERYFLQVQRFLEDIPPVVWVLLAILSLVLVAVVIVLTTVGRIGLIKGAALADSGTERLTFNELFSGSLPYFWRVFLLNLVIGIGIFLVFLIVAVPLAISVVGLICLIPLVCIAIPFLWLLNVVIEQANIAMVMEDRGMIAGLQRGWQMVTQNLGQYIVMAVILWVIGFVGALVIGIPLVVLIIPPMIDLAANRGTLGGGFLVSIVLFVLYLPVLLVGNGILQSYINSAWTLTFRRLTGLRPAAPEIITVPPAPLSP
jgi:hypothetical protein